MISATINRSVRRAAAIRPRRQYWAGLLSVLAVLVLTAATGTPAAAEQQRVVRISDDPFTNTTSPAAQHRTEVEPDTFSFGDTVVSAFQVGRVPNGGASDIGWAVTRDGGHSWHHGFLPAATIAANPPGRYVAASDASVAFDFRHHTWLISWLGLTAFGGNVVDVVVSRSTDDGRTWSAPVTVAATGVFYDKNWSACDNTPTSPFFGHCYTEFDNASMRDLELMSTSTDGGRTWGTAMATADNVHGLGGQPVIQPNGRVVVPFEGVTQPRGIRSFSSGDGGKSWNAAVLISAVSRHVVAGDIRTSPLPTAEVSGDGTVYVAWQDNRFETGGTANDIVLSSSRDGTTWSDVSRIPLNAVGSNVDHFIPGLAVDRFTRGQHTSLALTYYFYPAADCTAATCQLEVGFTSSRDGGQHWADPRTLAGPMSLSTLANTTQGVMVGDYISTSFVSSPFEFESATAVPAFAIGRTATDGSAFNESMFSTSQPVREGDIPLGHDPVVFTGGGSTGGDDSGTAPPTAF